MSSDLRSTQVIRGYTPLDRAAVLDQQLQPYQHVVTVEWAHARVSPVSYSGISAMMNKYG